MPVRSLSSWHGPVPLPSWLDRWRVRFLSVSDCLRSFAFSRCTTHCLRGYYGNNCQETCECNEDEQCNFVTGMCLSSVTQVNEDTNAITESTFYTSSATELMANLRQLNRSYWNNSYRKPPTLQKYYTFDVTTISTLNANQLGKEDRFPTKGMLVW